MVADKELSAEFAAGKELKLIFSTSSQEESSQKWRDFTVCIQYVCFKNNILSFVLSIQSVFLYANDQVLS